MATTTPPQDTNTLTAFPAGTSQDVVNKQVAAQGNQPVTPMARPGERNTTLEETNRQKMLASGELKADTNPQLAQQKVNLFTYGVEAPTFGPTTSSEPVRTDLANKTAEVNTQLNNLPAEKAAVNQSLVQLPTPEYKTYTDFTGEFGAAREANKTIYEKAQANIQADFALRQQQQEGENRVNAGFQSKQLARMNALGTGASGMAFLQQIDVQNQQKINQLLVQKEQVLLAAAQAAQNNDVKLLGDLVAESHAVTNQYNDIQKQRLQDATMTNKQIMEQTRFGWEAQDRAAKKLSDMAAINMPIAGNEKVISEFEKNAGLPKGYYDSLSKVVTQQKEIATEKGKIENEKAINEIRNMTPEGQKFQIGDTVYTGWKKAGPLWQAIETDQDGKVTLVYYDSSTKSYQKTDLGYIGKPNDGFTTTTDGQGNLYKMNTKTGDIEPAMTKGNYVNPNLLPGFGEWMNSTGVVTTHFGDSTINPNNKNGGEPFHPGWDIAPLGATSGQRAVTAFLPPNITGTVIEVHNTPNDNDFGRFIKIQDSEGRIWQYSHLATTGVNVGDSITKDTYLGQMGNSGNVFSTSPNGDGTHLDLRVKIPGEQITGKQTIAQQQLRAITESVKNEPTQPSGSVDAYIQSELQKKINTGFKVDADTQALRGYVDEYAATGTMPKDAPKWSGGIIRDAAAMMVADGTIISKTTKVKPSDVGKAQVETLAAAYNLVKTELPALKQAADEMGTLSSFHIPEHQALRSTKEQHYIDILNKVMSDYALAISGKVVTDSEMARLKQSFPGVGWNINAGTKIEDFQDLLNKGLKDRLDFYGYEVKGYDPLHPTVSSLDKFDSNALSKFDNKTQ